MLFSDRNELLKLYNAINGTSYDDPDLLQVNTLENAVYMSMQNDVSFIIDMRLNLYEHQSTYSPENYSAARDSRSVVICQIYMKTGGKSSEREKAAYTDKM